MAARRRNRAFVEIVVADQGVERTWFNSPSYKGTYSTWMPQCPSFPGPRESLFRNPACSTSLPCAKAHVMPIWKHHLISRGVVGLKDCLRRPAERMMGRGACPGGYKKDGSPSVIVRLDEQQTKHTKLLKRTIDQYTGNMMRAARFHGKEDVRIESIEKAKCGPGQIRVSDRNFATVCPRLTRDTS